MGKPSDSSPSCEIKHRLLGPHVLRDWKMLPSLTRQRRTAIGGCPLSPCGPWACARGLYPRLAYFLVRFGRVSWRTEGGCSSSHQPTLIPCRYRPAFCARVLRDLADHAATMHRCSWLSPMNCFGVTLRRELEMGALSQPIIAALCRFLENF
jgi:hypothetical protein